MANRTDFEEFVNDIFEVIETKSYKSYKSVKSNMEQYFHTQWGISRAQAYRFHACAKVLHDLKNFEVKPSRERMCRTLTKFTKDVKSRCLLWERSLLSANGDVKRITSTSIESDYKALVAAKLIPAVFFDRKQKTSESNDAKKFNILNEGNVIIDTDFKPAFTESLAIKTHKPFETPMTKHIQNHPFRTETPYERCIPSKKFLSFKEKSSEIITPTQWTNPFLEVIRMEQELMDSQNIKFQ